jgi:hypothetical protein
MLADLASPTLLLLHEGGWDEVLMVAASLGIAYLIIVWSGRRRNDADDEWDDEDVAADADPPEASDQSSQRRS